MIYSQTELVDSRLRRVDDSDVIRDFVTNKVADLDTKLAKTIEDVGAKSMDAVKKLQDENLLVDELIGPTEDCKYKNLVEWLNEQKDVAGGLLSTIKEEVTNDMS